MSDLLIRDVPEDLKDDLGRIARDTGRSMSDTAKDLIRSAMESQQGRAIRPPRNAYEQLRALFGPEDGGDDEFSKIMDEIEQKRKTNAGRPFSFDE